MPSTTKTSCDVLVLGGGAAGMMCALVAGQRGRKVILIEHNDTVGKKIGISGGGRCNFTNLHATPENYLSANPNFCKSALARYTPWDFVSLVEKHGIRYHEKKLGQQFCTGSSREIIAMLLRECTDAGVAVRCGCRVEEINKSDRFQVSTNQGLFECQSLVIATGSLSFSKLGATDFGHRTARQFGLRVTELRPGLVPLTFTREDHASYQELSGLSLPVKVSHKGTQFSENILFTHRGLSGPAILQISSFWREGESLLFDLLPDGQNPLERDSMAQPASLLERTLPRRFVETWCRRHVPQKPLRHFKDREFESLSHLLHHWTMQFSGTEGYAKAEVTLGGVDTGDLSSKTMEASRVPGLFFIGEVVDVTGWLGGYNFQWAWASGHAAGLSA